MQPELGALLILILGGVLFTLKRVRHFTVRLSALIHNTAILLIVCGGAFLLAEAYIRSHFMRGFLPAIHYFELPLWLCVSCLSLGVVAIASWASIRDDAAKPNPLHPMIWVGVGLGQATVIFLTILVAGIASI